MIDWTLQWAALLLSVTVYSGEVRMLAGLLLVPCLALGVLYRDDQQVEQSAATKKKDMKGLRSKKNNNSNNNNEKAQKVTTVKQFLPHKPFITAYRSSMLILTSISILAVDFHVFPRQFAKVETWGTSLMDLGVGSFVFSMGIVSCRGLLRDEFENKHTPYWQRVIQAVWGTFSCLVLGLIRLVAVKGLEYQEHVTEYGVHWNFFITLVLVGPLTIVISPLFKIIPRFFVALLIGFAYEMTLTYKEGLLQFLLLGERVDLISKNKEGLFSLIGYVAIFISGQSVAGFLLPSIETPKNLFHISKPSTNRLNKFSKLITVSSPLSGLAITFIIYTILAFLSVDTQLISPLPVSRRLANLPYVLWVCAYNTGFLFCYALIDSVFDRLSSKNNAEVIGSVSLEAVNKNGMFLFLLANVSTGLVNMSLNTLDCDDTVAVMVLMGYSLLLAGVVGLMLKRGWTVRI